MSEILDMSTEFGKKQGEYLIEEMKCLRSIINVWVEQIARLEIFTISSFGAVVYFYVSYQARFIDSFLRFVPLGLAIVLLLRGIIISHRIQTADNYLVSIEKRFCRDGAWVFNFKEKYTWKFCPGLLFPRIVIDRMFITIIFIAVGLFLAFCKDWILANQIIFQAALGGSYAPG
jgi:hypothetical protein